MLFEGVESTGPVRSIRFKPCIQLGERLGSQPVNPPLSVDPRFDKSCVAQNPEMPRDTRLVHAGQLDKLTHRPVFVSHEIEDAPTRGFRDHLENVQGSWHGF